MFDLISKLGAALGGVSQKRMSLDEAAELLKTTPGALEALEHSYQSVIDESEENDLFGINAKQASAENRTNIPDETFDEDKLQEMINNIIDELLAVTKGDYLLEDLSRKPVQGNDIKMFPESVRPQLTGNLMKVDFSAANYPLLLDMWRMYQANPKKNIHAYHSFRQGLDMLDLDVVMYEMLGMNPTSMGYWFPTIKEAAEMHGFFKIPETKIIKVPMTLLQLTRTDYFSLTPATLKIVDDYCMKVFDLDVTKSYFIKTGIFSSKYDFRNAKVTGEKEVRELGEYLLFIHWQTVQMAQPMSSPCIYGAATTNEWVVREFIEDKENNPCIYKGLPLHTEYRIFVDFDDDKVIGITPYWEPNMMKKRFSEGADKGSPHHMHDYLIFKSHEDVLMQRYNDNKDRILKEITEMLPDVKLEGQWAIDIMQNGDDFWLIDMSLAANSALIECVPKELLKKQEENWIPDLSKRLEMQKEKK